MFKQLKAATVAGAIALAFVVSAPAFSQSNLPSNASEVGNTVSNVPTFLPRSLSPSTDD